MVSSFARHRRLASLVLATALLAASFSSALAQSARPGAGKVVADLGFRTEVNGFAFENYGEPPDTDLTSAELRRMFGDRVCANLAGGKCTLTPPGKEWMKEINKAMQGGHCEGIAALSLLMYTGKEKPADFGGPTASALRLEGNSKLQREIAYWFATQYTVPTGPSEIKTMTPNEVLDTLIKSFKAGTSGETYTMGIYRSEPPLSGHAILPYAVEDRGGGKFGVLVYDNNWPGTRRALEINRNDNTWSYQASTNPDEDESLYEGDEDTFSLTLTPTSPRLVQQACPFCGKGSKGTPADAKGAAAGAVSPFDELWLEGKGHLLIADAQGRRYGYSGGKMLKEIPGVSSSYAKGWNTWQDDDDDPIYYIPTGMAFTVTIDGTGLKQTADDDVILIGPGYDLAVEGIKLRPGQKDTLTLSPATNKISYQTTSDQSPNLDLGLETDAADYEFDVKGVVLQGGGTITVALDAVKGQLSISVAGSKAPGTYAISMERTDDQDDLTFSHDKVSLAPGDTAYLNFGKWSADGDSIPLGIDRGSKGSIDETVDLTDE